MQQSFGQHYIIELGGCDPARLERVAVVEPIFLRAARDCRATVLEHHFHQFEPVGVSGVVLIAESHLALHTWPEAGFVAVDIFTCGEQMDPDVAVQVLRTELRATQVEVRVLQRGISTP